MFKILKIYYKPKYRRIDIKIKKTIKMMKASQIIKINLLKTISLSIVNPLLEIY
jgi:hypothetical protein